MTPDRWRELGGENFATLQLAESKMEGSRFKSMKTPIPRGGKGTLISPSKNFVHILGKG